MENDKLPINILNFSILKLNHDAVKICRCENRTLEIDTVNRLIRCATCGVIVDPFDAMVEICNRRDEFRRNIEYLLEQKRRIANYKPHAEIIKSIEKSYTKDNMLPCRPACSEPFLLEELTHWSGRNYA